ncbi:molybdate ABC transporter substrate-binding protein [Streptomyces sp. ISL-90]|nr:molybdate ABC transporter substrate-binding protein [Streptomyces sp. ISL-90]
MRRMPRRVVAVAVALAAMLGGAACASPSDGGSPSAAVESTTPPAASSTTITVFAAASLTEAFDELATRFEQEHPPVEIVINYGGSAALARQIVEGAPADVFASAAEQPMQIVADADLAASPVLFATNTLQLVVPAGNPARVADLNDLARPELTVALCDESVPCGAASVELLERQSVTAAPDTLESDVRAVLTKVSLGEVDAGLVYRTDVLAAGDAVEGIEVAGAASVVNRYPISVLTDAADARLAADFVAFVAGAEGRAVMAEAGFGAP